MKTISSPPSAGAGPAETEETVHPVRAQAKALFRHSVLDAAEAELAAHGFEATRMQDVAKRARVAVGTIYNHFPHKEDLLRAVLEARGHEALAEFAPRPDDGATWEERFLARFSRLHAFFARHQRFFQVAARHGFLAAETPGECAPHESAMEVGMRAQVERLLLEGIELGALDREDPVRLARFLKGATKGVLMGAALQGELDLEAEGRWVLERFLRAMRPTDRKVSP